MTLPASTPPVRVALQASHTPPPLPVPLSSASAVFPEIEDDPFIVMTPSEIRVRRVNHRGHVMEWTLNPLWVQLEQTGDPEFGIERLYLVSRGRRVPVGYFLGPEEKASFYKALLAALQTAKRGITYNPIN